MLKLRSIIESIFRLLKNRFKIKQKFHFNQFFIELPPDHKLAFYMQAHPKYDRFLPHLVKYLNSNKTVVDVGANCGDTLAGLIEKNQSLTYVCIEPDQSFYDFMLKNIKFMRVKYPSINVITVKSLIGKNISNVFLEGKAGTKHAVPGSGKMNCKSLDEILSDIIIPPVVLLKTDVDGFDFDVINSSRGLLIEQQPIIFFECQTDFEYQKEGFETTILDLSLMGYDNWTIFDNFGALLLRTRDIQQVYCLMEYVWLQNIKKATRTIYYLDILASTHKHTPLLDTILKDYSHEI